MPSRSSARAAGVLGLLALLWGARALGLLPGPGGTTAPGAAAPTDPAGTAIAEAFRSKRSGMMVEGRGTLARVLPDEREGDRHQRFILELEGGHTVLVAHNIDVAPRVPIGRDDEGASIEFRGQYEWNAEGGVLHWTHHDPDGSRPGGWLRFAGRLYE